MIESLSADFVIGNMCEDLVSMTIDFCTKDKHTKTYRFPTVLNFSFVSRIVNKSMHIDECIAIGNAYPRKSPERLKHYYMAKGNLVHMSRMIRICYMKGWISEKQHDRCGTEASQEDSKHP